MLTQLTACVDYCDIHVPSYQNSRFILCSRTESGKEPCKMVAAIEYLSAKNCNSSL